MFEFFYVVDLILFRICMLVHWNSEMFVLLYGIFVFEQTCQRLATVKVRTSFEAKELQFQVFAETKYFFASKGLIFSKILTI